MEHAFHTAEKPRSRSPGRTSSHAPMLMRQSRAASQDVPQPKFDRCACGGSCPRCRGGSQLQKKLAISEPGDVYEQEADRVADEVMRMPAHPAVNGVPPRIQRFAGPPTGQAEAAPARVDQTLASAGTPLEPMLQQGMEQRFSHDFSSVRIHSGAPAEQSVRDVNAQAYTVGHDIVFGAGRFAPGTHEGRRLIAHELTHVVQQSGADGIRAGQSKDKGLSSISAPAPRAPSAGASTIVQRQNKDPLDAGVEDEPLPGGIREPPPQRKPSEMSDAELGPAIKAARNAGDTARVEAIEAEMDDRVSSWGTAAPAGPGPVTTGVGAFTPEVALQMLENMAGGQPAFKPELGLGGCSWFTTEGNPYAGTAPAKSINIQVEITKGSNPLLFKEADLVKIYNAEAGPAAAQAEAEYRAKFNIDALAKLSNRAQKAINRVLRGLTEKRMWQRVGEQVAASAKKVGEVVLEPGSRFSATTGKFAVVADASKITIKGGPGPIVDALGKAGVSAEPTVVEAAEALAKKLKWAGRVRGVFRWGGRVLIVVAVTQDLIKIYHAKDKWKATLTSVGGWTGATAAGAAFAAWWTPAADVAGPWAWAANGVGTLVAGGIGYWIGSETVRNIYELAVDP